LRVVATPASPKTAMRAVRSPPVPPCRLPPLPQEPVLLAFFFIGCSDMGRVGLTDCVVSRLLNPLTDFPCPPNPDSRRKPGPGALTVSYCPLDLSLSPFRVTVRFRPPLFTARLSAITVFPVPEEDSLHPRGFTVLCACPVSPHLLSNSSALS